MSGPPITAYPLRARRVHEVCGASAMGFAAIAVGRAGKEALWVREGWRAEVLNPAGLAALCDPARLLVAVTRNQTETLAVAEEALRDGSVPFVVMELGAPITLTIGRRLQLAAGAGQTTGICLISEGMGSNAAETRWRASPLFAQPDSTSFRWELIKNKSGTLGAWQVQWDAATHRLSVVSPSAERPGAEGAPG